MRNFQVLTLKGSQMKVHDSLIIKLGLNLKSAKNFLQISKFKNLKLRFFRIFGNFFLRFRRSHRGYCGRSRNR